MQLNGRASESDTRKLARTCARMETESGSCTQERVPFVSFLHPHMSEFDSWTPVTMKLWITKVGSPAHSNKKASIPPRAEPGTMQLTHHKTIIIIKIIIIIIIVIIF